MTESVKKCYHTLWLPERFYEDHVERSLPSGEPVRYAGSRVLVKCTLEELREIQDDANYYSDMTKDDFGCNGEEYKESYRSLVQSAERTANCIEKYLKALGE